MPIALRAFTTSEQRANAPMGSGRSALRPSDWTLVFDCETSTDAAQRLRFGTYQVRHRERLHEQGMFYEPDALSVDEFGLLEGWSQAQEFQLLSRAEFVEEVFFPFGYDDQATIVGLNLPFDLSRIAISHGSARSTMRGGFSFKLSPSSRRPYVQVKHLSARAALIRFTHPGKQLTPRGMRNRGIPVHPHRGFFVDIRTLAAALTSTSHSLASLGEFLGIEHRKLTTEEHGGPLSKAYLAYAMRDVQATWECYREMLSRYQAHGLTQTSAHAIKSEAGLGKAYLRDMAVLPWRQAEPDFPSELLGKVLSSYFGGRAEVHIRRMPVRVLYCDFLSMYPTVCTLMGLWRFVIADGMTWHDSTIETRTLLERLTVADLQHPEAWPQLRTLVRIRPQGDVLPVRAQYGDESQNTIGLNHLTSDEPLWFTLADCLASKLLTGRAPQIVEAISFEPNAPQEGLQPVTIAGKAAYRVSPKADDFYRTVIDLRSSVKRRLGEAKQQGRHEEAERLNPEQLSLKILANATSYGIFVEVNVEELEGKVTVRCFGADGRSFPVQTTKLEKPGTYFHPLLATLITGAARLLLAIAEQSAIDAGLGWAFCDTDSMALTQPAGMPEEEFLLRADGVRGWFDALNPYAAKGELLKLEDANSAPDGAAPGPLYCYAVSAKRYALYNLDGAGRPIIRKASAHGLGHLTAPYSESDAPASIPAPRVPLTDIGVERWQHDLWYQIISAELAGRPDQPRLDFHPALEQPAIGRYSATTPKLLLDWFKGYNADRPYHDQVRPFGFLTVLHARRGIPSPGVDNAAPDGSRSRRRKMIRPIAPFDRDPASAPRAAFDRETGSAVTPDQLATYREALAQYHLHPETKFLNGDYLDRGVTQRRHILATHISYIGKEANRWEEQFFAGPDDDAAVEYGAAPEAHSQLAERVREGVRRYKQHTVARAARMSLRDVNRAAQEGGDASSGTIARLAQVLAKMAAAADRQP
jgi:hypothetical protein